MQAQVGELEQRLQRGLTQGIDSRTARLEQVWTEAAVELQRRRRRWLWRWTRPWPVPGEVQRQGAGFGEEMDGYLRETLYPLLNEKRQGEIDAIYSRHGLPPLGQ